MSKGPERKRHATMRMAALREPTESLLFARLLDGTGGAISLDWEGVKNWTPTDGMLWVHLDYRHPDSLRWLRNDSGLDAVEVQALTDVETRPRAVAVHQSILCILRGVNLNPDASPDDMVAVRLWIAPKRLITLRHRPSQAIDDVCAQLDACTGPRDIGDLVGGISEGLVNRIVDAVDDLDDDLEDYEDLVVEGHTDSLQNPLGALRRQAIRLRRYLVPQRDALTALQAARVDWLDDPDRMRIRELSDRMQRCIEELESTRDRASVTMEELHARIAENTGRTMYLMTLLTALFLPLTFVTGLLGINVAGIPFAESPIAFFGVCATLGGLFGLEIYFFKRQRWL
jgi:zinc transporter